MTVMLYGSECWRITDTEILKLETFHRKCLRHILNIWWPNVITNSELYEKSKTVSVKAEIEKRRLRLLGHILRMPNHRVPKIALKWTPATGKRSRGRPKCTWRRTIERDLKARGLTMGEAAFIGKDRSKLRSLD